MSQLHINLSETARDLTTRGQGEDLRKRIAEGLRDIPDGGSLVVSFAGVDAMTPSFADECFGKLLTELGRESLSSRLRLIDASAVVRAVVNAAMNNRARLGNSSAAP